MTYKGTIAEVKMLLTHSLMPNIFKPSLKKIAETLEMERPKELTLSEVETYANEHNYVLWTDEMSEKALALIKADRNRPKGEWIESKERSKHWYCSVCGGIHTDPETGKWRETFDYRYPFCPNCGADMRGKTE